MRVVEVEKGLPTNVDGEKFVLGSILLDDTLYAEAVSSLEADDFSLESHRRIFKRMGELQARNEKIERITVANELMKFNELDTCGGLSYLVELDDGLPQIPSIDSYIRIVKEKATLRKIIFASQHMMNRALAGEETSEEILAGAEETLFKLANRQEGTKPVSTKELVDSIGIDTLLSPRRHGEIRLPWARLDRVLSGFAGGQIIVVLG